VTLRLFLVAGEASGDALGAALMRGLRAEAPEVAFTGVGGPQMAGEGLVSLFPQEDLAVMGLVEVLPRLPVILRRLRQTTAACVAGRPAALVTIDAPSFGLRVADRVRDAAPGVRRVHYVAPQVWAWRPGRARTLGRRIDHLLALLPFEPAFFADYGLSCDFVGHPAATRPHPTREEAAAFRDAIGVPRDAPLLAALPGSRAGELRRHLGPFGETVARLAARAPGLRVVAPTLGARADALRQAAAGWAAPTVVLDPAGLPPDEAERRKRLAFVAADAALAASGTVTLELAAAGTPMVAVYRANALTAAMVRRMIRVDTAILVNLVAGEKAVPELLQERFTPDAAADALAPLFVDGPERRRQLAAGARAMAALGRGGEDPGRRAARSLLAAIARAPAAGVPAA
jgi:lipid-A-disaccharide synthase